MKEKYERIIKGIQSYFKESGFSKAVIGLSGGIDSSLSAKVVADAIGRENVIGLILPFQGISSDHSINDAMELGKMLRINYKVVQINDFVKPFGNLSWDQSKIAQMNTMSRVRAVILYNLANSIKGLVIGTSNKTEIEIGFFTKYGDGAVDVEVIGSLWKTEVWEMSKMLGIPKQIIEKVPSAELYTGHTDEDEIGLSYKRIDEILQNKEKYVGTRDSKVLNLFERIENNKHKRESVKVI